MDTQKNIFGARHFVHDEVLFYTYLIFIMIWLLTLKGSGSMNLLP